MSRTKRRYPLAYIVNAWLIGVLSGLVLSGFVQWIHAKVLSQ